MKNVAQKVISTDHPSGWGTGGQARHENKKERKGRGRQAARNYAADGIMKDIVLEARRRHANDPLEQVAYYLYVASRRGIPSGTGRRRTIGEKRQTEIGNTLMRAVKDAPAARCPIQNVTDISQGQVIALVRYWTEVKHLASGTIDDRVSILRRFFIMMGRRNVIPTGSEWRELLRRHGIVLVSRSNMTVLAKGWRDMGVDPDKVIAAVAAKHEVVACHLEMMYMFGLRRKECVMLRPHESDQDSYILVRRGTKGGKERQVKFSSNPEKRARQRAALEWAKRLADKHRDGELAVPGKSLETMLAHQRYVFRKFGIYAGVGGLGVVPHGLRHQFACDLFEELTGWPAPVLGRLPMEHYKKNARIVKEAMLEVSRQLGHERPQVSGAYISTPDTMGRQEKIRLQRTLEAVASQAELLQQAAIDTIWITGRAALGLPLLDGERMTMLVRLQDIRSAELAMLDVLSDALGVQLGHPVTVAHWMGAEVPSDGAEVMFTPPGSGAGRA